MKRGDVVIIDFPYSDRTGSAEGEPVPQGGVGAAMMNSGPDTTSHSQLATPETQNLSN